MWEDKYRKIVRSKPSVAPAPQSTERTRNFWRLLGPGLFRKRRIHFLGFAAFFVIGIVVGVIFGPSSGPMAPSEEPKTAERPHPVGDGRRDESPPPSSRRDGSEVRLKAYAFSTPAPGGSKDSGAMLPKADAPPAAGDLSVSTRGILERKPAATRTRSETLLGDVPGAGGARDPGIGERKQPQWLAYAVPEPADTVEPRIALVIDDLGIDQARTRRAIALPGPLTMAFLPYGYHLDKLTAAAKAAGHELIVHLPMQPQLDETNPGPNALLRNLTPEELRERITWNLTRFNGFVGLNNHMGSGFTVWGPGVTVLLEEVKARGLLFLDSLTSKDSVAGRIAGELDIPYAVRDVFLDNEQEALEIRRQLEKLEEIARKRGYAVGIGHPHDVTIDTLRAWIDGAKARGLSIVPLSAIVKKRRVAG